METRDCVETSEVVSAYSTDNPSIAVARPLRPPPIPAAYRRRGL